MPDSVFALLNQHFAVPRETCERLVLYHDLLVSWQARVNLVGPKSLPLAWTRHFLDALQLLPLLPSSEVTLMDIGSGAGFPGMVLAIAGVRQVHLVESDGKKISFLREVARVTQTAVHLHPQRVETLRMAPMDVIVSRACSDLDTLLHYSYPHVSHETLCLFPKGRNYTSELEDARKHWDFDMVVANSVTDPQGVILSITGLTRRGYASGRADKDQNSGDCESERRRGKDDDGGKSGDGAGGRS